MESNLLRLSRFFENAPTRLRPHYKNHKCIALAKRQLAAGAIGITCATLQEAETLLAHGIDGILIANEIAGRQKIEHFVHLASEADVTLAVDHVETVRQLAAASRSHAVVVRVVVDVDIGLGRCGVRPGKEALDLAQEVLKEGLLLRGLMGYEGRVRHPPGPVSQNACEAAMAKLALCRRLLEENGIPVEIVSAGGTGTYSIAGLYPGITEIQAGSYIVMDREYHAICPDFEPVLTVLATVVSKNSQERAVIDAGFKSISGERGLPMLKNVLGMELRKLNAEHGVIEILDSRLSLKIGDQVELWVECGDATVNLHDRMFGIRREAVEEVFRIEG